MEDIIRQIRYKILDNGFMNLTSISRELKELGIEEKDIPQAIKMIDEEPDIHKIKYTNRFIAKYCSRDLYYYNPNKKKRKPRKQKKT